MIFPQKSLGSHVGFVSFATFFINTFGSFTRFRGFVTDKDNVITYTGNDLSQGLASLHARLKNAGIRFLISGLRLQNLHFFGRMLNHFIYNEYIAGMDFHSTLTLKTIKSKIVSIRALYDKLCEWVKDILQLCTSVFTTGQFILVMVYNLKSMAGLVLLINEKHREKRNHCFEREGNTPQHAKNCFHKCNKTSPPCI